MTFTVEMEVIKKTNHEIHHYPNLIKSFPEP